MSMEKGYRLQIYSFDTIDSTQKYLIRELKAKTLHAPVAVLSALQTEGIGSRANQWNSQQGNLFFSFAIQQNSLPKDLKLESTSIYFSYILKEILKKFNSKVWIKWPNDFYIDEKKIGGMITNIVGTTLVCGIGLNIATAPENFAKLDVAIDKELLLKKYFANIEKKVLWKQVFSKYKLEFYMNQNFFTHVQGLKVSLADAILNDDGSLEINGERIYSLR